MSIALLRWICDITGKSNQLFIDYLNNKNEIPPSIVYILIIRKASDLVGACVKTGFTLDNKCIRLACIMKNCELIKLCMSQGLMPTEDDVNDLIYLCIHTGKKYHRWNSVKLIESATDIYNKDTLLNFIDIVANGKAINSGYLHYNSIYSTDYGKNFYNIMVCIPKITGCQRKYEAKWAKNDITQCLNCILNNGYSMTKKNWDKFNESTLEIKNIQLKDNTKYAATLCSFNKFDIITFIKQKKLTLDRTCLENAIKGENLDVIKYIIKDVKLKIDNDLIDLAISKNDLNIIKFVVENYSDQPTDSTIDDLYTIALKENEVELLNLVNKQFKQKPREKILVEYITKIPSMKFLYDNNLILCNVSNNSINNASDTISAVTVQINNKTSTVVSKKTNSNTSINSSARPWFMC
jgi:hypothetical protein